SELATPAVNVAGFAPRYDPARQLWYAEVDLRVERAYFPFVRLALARFQPISVPGAHLSPVVLSDFVQVVPHRSVEYQLTSGQPGGLIPVTMRGPSYAVGVRRQLTTSVMVLRLERREHGDSHADEPLGWEPISTSIVNGSSVDGHQMQWIGRIPLPDPLPLPLRVTVLEIELHRTDGRPPADLLNLLKTAGSAIHDIPALMAGQDQPMGYRVVFADSTVVG
ncbi:MAG: hypothetical protein H0U67_07550, partial [Gemmatimonadetes bacterium]|nr:hypothetical protein [Gemmatimonadota bacterium]